MKLFELESAEQTSRPIVYVDMDGVLADMWGQVAKHHNVAHWRKARKKQRVDQIGKEPGFFKRLKPLPNAGILIRGILKAAGQYSILSSPMMSRVEQSVNEKTEWLQHHLNRNPPQSVLFDHNKEKFAMQADGTPNILIDDYKTNVNLWRARGGIAILYKDSEIDRVFRELYMALRGHTHHEPMADEPIEKQEEGKYLTSRDVLKYVKGIHNEYHLDAPILAHKVWQLKYVPVESLKNPEFYDQDDPYRRLIDLDWDHIKMIGVRDIETKPVVADDRGWLLDGNHRAIAARARGMKYIPAYIPVSEHQIHS